MKMPNCTVTLALAGDGGAIFGFAQFVLPDHSWVDASTDIHDEQYSLNIIVYFSENVQNRKIQNFWENSNFQIEKW